ncbi:MAG: hypothetical protein ACYCZF_15775 [Anaerolineae bacterium]
MRINYSLMPQGIMDEEHKLLPILRAAGVDQIWIVDYFFGHHVSTPELTVKARHIVESQGFDGQGIVSVPVGHPGNALNPEDLSLDLRIPEHWRYRINRHGKPVYFCADIEAHMIADNVAAVRLMADQGFTQFFMDDDLRQGNWGREIQGCFCDHCISEFCQHLGQTISRLELSLAIERMDDPVVLEEWTAYQCLKVQSLMAALAEQGQQVGTMAMHHGDERHGLDLAALRHAYPDMLVRVGEMYFSDDDYGKTAGKVSQLVGILQHLKRVGRHNSYSETTIFPPRALSPANWIHKMKLTLAAGTENLFFMGGTWIIEDNYWQAEINALPGIKKLAVLAEPERRFPIHVVSGTHGSCGEVIDPPTLPFLAGLPATPARANDWPCGSEVLLAFGDYDLGKAWEGRMSRYTTVICDETALERNPFLRGSGATILPYKVAEDKPGALVALRHALAKTNPAYPWLVEGRDMCLFWVGDGVLILNMLAQVNPGVLALTQARRAFTLPPQAIAYAPLAGQTIGELQVID